MFIIGLAVFIAAVVVVVDSDDDGQQTIMPATMSIFARTQKWRTTESGSSKFTGYATIL